MQQRVEEIYEKDSKSDGSLTPDMTYNGWSWELERTLLGTWKLADAGYA